MTRWAIIRLRDLRGSEPTPEGADSSVHVKLSGNEEVISATPYVATDDTQWFSVVTKEIVEDK